MQTDYDYGGFTMWDTFFREMLGDLTDLDNLKSQVESSGLLYVFFLAATLVLYIAMLNLLIAIISDTIARVKQAEKFTKIWEKWNIITEIDIMRASISSNKKDNKKQYLMYLYNEKQADLTDFEKTKKILEEFFNKIMEENQKIKEENDRSIKKIQESVINELKKSKENP